MPAKNNDLHGNVPDQCSAALILIDVINDMEFENGEALLKNALPAAKKLAALKRRAKDAGIPVIYVNDNFGKWRSDFRQQLGHVLNDGVRGQRIAEILRPDEDDYFVLKAKHSGFYHTQLDLLIDYLRVRTVVLAGFATDMCVLFTASDAYLRGAAGSFLLRTNSELPTSAVNSQTAKITDVVIWSKLPESVNTHAQIPWNHTAFRGT